MDCPTIMPISSQAIARKKATEGSETSSRAKAVTEPRVPSPSTLEGEDIVRHPEKSGNWFKRPGKNIRQNHLDFESILNL